MVYCEIGHGMIYFEIGHGMIYMYYENMLSGAYCLIDQKRFLGLRPL